MKDKEKTIKHLLRLTIFWALVGSIFAGYGFDIGKMVIGCPGIAMLMISICHSIALFMCIEQQMLAKIKA